VTADDDEQQRHVDPTKETELSSKLRACEVRDERDESCNACSVHVHSTSVSGLTDHVESETDQSMVLGKGESGREEARLLRQDVLEVVDETLAIEEVVCRREEVPVLRRQPSSLH
jgi:hypothetical protein